MSELGRVSLWRFRETIQFGILRQCDMGNGNIVPNFTPKVTRKAARYRISTRMLLSNSGIDWENDKVFALRHLRNQDSDDLKSYKALWNGNYYNVTNVIPDDSKIVGCDLITLHSSNKNSQGS